MASKTKPNEGKDMEKNTLKATEYFDIDMTSDEARRVYFEKYKEAKSINDLEELKAAYSAISLAILRRDMERVSLYNEVD